ncbi:tRNA threonylcarbamoyladenosine biosynthesis protein TsaE [Insulibacter thermoxylanivorax]|uniref:tRNA threonylcarbamoyladenosine biosynthesis protein TsaE n=1 Tax=Insulibacter thermoxylanivorax TaxID=2749268 RepID=A0A916QAE6_9BACL|nr:tRNA (adenosine(37)-N6)-threonylcarbamoyltransferase complex ATPase subunit type 1 TsaE [Insulibacter thermoxylanivorax]GFR37080.1 tRNA threonylcarbamoyladenosine biosynthesis protein TsaE [Insulibacter thermoxylanivorax]
MRKLTIRAANEQDTERLAAHLAACCRPGTIIALDGDLGAGKTRLTQAIARELGVQGIVNSPTFTIIKEYEGRDYPLYHMDVYRISEDEAAELGLEEYFEGDGVTIVEWASLIESLLPQERFEIYIEVTGIESRNFHLAACGEAYEDWLDGLEGEGSEKAWQNRAADDAEV